jgi:hypothetical protein
MAGSLTDAEIRDAVVQCLGYCGWDNDIEPNLAKCLDVLRKTGWEDADLAKVASKVRSLCAGSRVDLEQ